jgi:hypothetical protein
MRVRITLQILKKKHILVKQQSQVSQRTTEKLNFRKTTVTRTAATEQREKKAKLTTHGLFV